MSNVKKASLNPLLAVAHVRPVPSVITPTLARSELLALLRPTDSALIAQVTFTSLVMVQTAGVCLVAPNATRVKCRRKPVAETSLVVASCVHQAHTKLEQKEA